VIRFEAAVAGGIPVIKTMTESLAGNEIRRVMGVMNGTCNYILTRMESAACPMKRCSKRPASWAIWRPIRRWTWAASTPGHKLALLAAIAFGTKVSFDAVEIEGIERVSIDDIRRAADMGYRIKLLGVAQMTGRGLEQRMSPCLVPADSPLGQLQGGTNMVVVEGDSGRPDRAARRRCRRRPDRQRGHVRRGRDRARRAHAQLWPAGRRSGRPQAARTAVPAPITCACTLTDKPGALAKVATDPGRCRASRSTACANMAIRKRPASRRC
jgi:homoserine dehydrogenase